MDSVRDGKPTDWKEARRLRAWELVQQGWKQQDVAAALGVTGGAVSQWVSKAREGGLSALRRRKPPGGPSKLRDEQRGQLPELLGRGPAAYEFYGEVWTRRRVAQVIEQEFGVSYDPSHVGRILKGGGFSLPKPALRTTLRNEDAILDWRQASR